ncbi:N-acetylglucosamine-6-phosphate deacetylase [Paracoccus sp. (in: a-proteobacteria)]|uniref:N-acetylglucosamine-6-phosphate deacetylase n=1 Tax=Paracoccus sp. TaxID=267 RepID=UPI003A89547D
MQVFHAERIFDGEEWHNDAALLVDEGRVQGIRPSADAPEGMRLPGWIAPGLIDLQVNGGGGVLFNNDTTPEGIARICAAHAGFGTTAVMITLITDRPDVTDDAIAAGLAGQGIPGFLGMHLEGPHLALARKGTHDPALIRKMEDADLARILAAAAKLPHLITTVAPESVTDDQIRAMAGAGVVVSLGHTDTTHESARHAADAGAAMITHLFNAMSQLAHRAPGVVGAALEDGRLWCGLIADGFHVDDAAMRIALRAKQGPGQIFLVSDAMSTIGTDLTGFTLNGRQILRSGGRLTLAGDGSLAGADIAQIDGIRYLVQRLDVDPGQALRMGSALPAQAMGITDRGHLHPGAHADFFCFDADFHALQTYIAGVQAA